MSKSTSPFAPRASTGAPAGVGCLTLASALAHPPRWCRCLETGVRAGAEQPQLDAQGGRQIPKDHLPTLPPFP